MEPLFEGVGTALVTPFKRNGKIDYDAFAHTVIRQRESGVRAIVVAGTTGEASTLKREEKEELFKLAVEFAEKKIVVIAATGDNDTLEAVSLTRSALNAGVDGVLCVTPYYNKTSEKGVLRYYKAIAAVGLPVIVYHVPSRTGLRIKKETFFALGEIDGIIGVKEADGLLAETVKWALPLGERLHLYSGNDALNLPMLSIGGKGFISVLSNVLPEQTVGLYESYKNGRFNECVREQARLSRLVELLFEEVNPIPVKYAVSLSGVCKNVLRSPLTGLCAREKKRISEELKKWIKKD